MFLALALQSHMKLKDNAYYYYFMKISKEWTVCKKVLWPYHNRPGPEQWPCE